MRIILICLLHISGKIDDMSIAVQTVLRGHSSEHSMVGVPDLEQTLYLIRSGWNKRNDIPTIVSNF